MSNQNQQSNPIFKETSDFSGEIDVSTLNEPLFSQLLNACSHFAHGKSAKQFGGGEPFSMRFVMTLKRDVEPSVLREAVEEGMRKLPFFCVELKIQDPDFVYVYNHRPFVVKEGDDTVLLNSADTNFHQLIFSFRGKNIYLDLSHTMTDGEGAINIIRFVLASYLNKRENINLSLDFKGSLVQGGVRIDDYASPYYKLDSSDIPPHRVKNMPKKALMIDKNDDRQILYRLKIKENEFIDFVKRNHSSPTSFSALMLNRAVYAVTPSENIRCSCCVNVRKFISAPRGHQNLVWVFMLPYLKDVIDRPLFEQLALTHNLIKEETKTEHITNLVKFQTGRIRKICRKNTLKERIELVNSAKVDESIHSSSTVSYLRCEELKDLEDYLTDLYDTSFLFEPILLEITVLNGDVIFNFQQNFSDRRYFDAFVKEIENCGLNYTLLPEEEWKICCEFIPYQ